ncbi:MAG: Eco29kI family restriction endonuclease [Rhodospirillaceae bacterium]
MMSGDFAPYNPLDKRNLAASVAEALLGRQAVSLGDVVAATFYGAGIYVLYYTGPFLAYAPLAERNRQGCFEVPIYIGKAVPSGARKGGDDLQGAAGTALSGRLKDHAESIQAARETLDIADFHCRFLVVEDIWIPLGESLLITKFSPVWNIIVEGFGNHNPGSGRHRGKRPRWDVVHPGRAWAELCAARDETADDILAKVGAHFRL